MFGFRSFLVRALGHAKADTQSKQDTQLVTATTAQPLVVQPQATSAPAVTREEKTTTPAIVGPFLIKDTTFGSANSVTALKGAASDSSSTSTDSHGARSASSIEAEHKHAASSSDAFAWSTDFPTDYFEARVKWDPRVISDEFARIAFFLWRRRVLDDSAPFQDLGAFAQEVEANQCKPREHPSYY